MNQPDDDFVRLLPVAPGEAYAYWGVRDETFERAKQSVGDEHSMVLRVFDVDGEQIAEFIVGGSAGEYFFQVSPYTRRAAVDVGLRDSAGHFAHLVSSPQRPLACLPSGDREGVRWGRGSSGGAVYASFVDGGPHGDAYPSPERFDGSSDQNFR